MASISTSALDSNSDLEREIMDLMEASRGMYFTLLYKYFFGPLALRRLYMT